MPTDISRAILRLRRTIVRDVDSVEEVVEFPFFDLDRYGAGIAGRRNAEAIPVEPLVEEAHPAPVEEENLQGILPTPEEHEQSSSSSVASDAIECEVREPIKAPTEINRLERDEHLDAMRNHAGPAFHVRASEPTTESRRDPSTSFGT